VRASPVAEGYRKVLERNGSWREALDLAGHTNLTRDVALHTN
jgi:hypothetical protein